MAMAALLVAMPCHHDSRTSWAIMAEFLPVWLPAPPLPGSSLLGTRSASSQLRCGLMWLLRDADMLRALY